MAEHSIALLLSAFAAGVITFLAPCTLPLVPAYLSFISGVAVKDAAGKRAHARRARRTIFRNGALFVLGFSLVFIAFGTLAGLLGGALGEVRVWSGRIAGIIVILFGLMMVGALRLPLPGRGGFALPAFLYPGKAWSSFAVGSAFGFGWTPCVGPILGSILLLASTEGTVFSGAVLLAVFSLGLAVPFLFVAAGVASAAGRIRRFLAWVTRYRALLLALAGAALGALATMAWEVLATLAGAPAPAAPFAGFAWLVPVAFSVALGWWAQRHPQVDVVGAIGGLFLIALGFFLLTNSFDALVRYGFTLLEPLNYQSFLLERL